MESLEAFLTKIGLQALIPVFTDNEINMENILKLDNEMLKELIPSIGQRIHFLAELQEFHKKHENVIEIVNADESTDGDNESGNSEFEEPSCSTNAIDVTAVNRDYFVVPSEPREISFIGLENMYKEIVFPDFDLKTLLEITPLGNTVVNYYKKKNYLDNSRRTILVDIIMKKLYNFYVTHRLTHEHYNIITSKILSVFPNECAATYYVPAIPKRNSLCNKPIVAKGRLVDKCRNILRMTKAFNCDNVKASDAQSSSKNTQEMDINSEMFNDKLWLQNRNTPWEEVVERWKRTFELRQGTKSGTIVGFIKEWPILNQISSASLIEIDFERLYPNSSLNIHLNWKKFIARLLEVKQELIKEKFATDLLEIIQNESAEENTQIAAEVMILSYLVPPKGRTKIKGGKHWKFSTIEASESMILHCKIPGDVESTIQGYKKKLADLKQPIQPFIVIEGPGLSDIRASYVVLDDIKYKIETVLKCFDICFKIFHVLNVSYPLASEHIWYLIQKSVYEISTEKDKIIPYIMDLAEYIKNSE